MKKIFLFILFSLSNILSTQLFAECNQNAKTLWFDQYSDGKYSYECNVINSCLGKKFGGWYWNFDTSKQLIKKHDKTKYPDLSKEQKSFDEIKKIYQKTQDTIFECAVLKSKYAAHKQIIKDQNPPKNSKKYLEKLNENIKSKLKEKECLNYDEADKVYNYKDLLDSLTYEECVYNMYLYYYEEKMSYSLWSIASENEKYKKAIDISTELEETKNNLENEYSLSQKSLTNALKTYENFHKTYIPYILLEMNYIEIMKNKSFIAKIMHVINDLVGRTTGAQKQTN